MKKILLVLLIAIMIATPSFAQEVEPEGIFSLHGTLWQSLPTGVQLLPFPSLVPIDWKFGFYRGELYHDGSNSFYIDMFACSFFWSALRQCNSSGRCGTRGHSGILQPIGIGIVVEWEGPGPLYKANYMTIGFLVKTNDNWVPPEFVSISPNKGEQGAILKDVSIRGLNTSFASGNVVVAFIHPYGEIISNIRPISDTEIKFDLEIPAYTTIGFRSVYVTWDGGYWYGPVGYVGASDAFEVLPQTN